MVGVSGSDEGEGLEPITDAQPEPDDGVDEAPHEMPRPAVQPSVPRVAVPTSPDAVVETLRRLREDVGQISELSSEEGSIVAAFSLAFLKLMEPLTKALPVDARVLPPLISSRASPRSSSPSPTPWQMWARYPALAQGFDPLGPLHVVEATHIFTKPSPAL